MSDSDHLAVYGFSFDYPRECRLEFNRKFGRTEGDLAIKSPRSFNLFVSWGPLEKLSKTATTLEEHARFSLERITRSSHGRLQKIEGRELNVKGHRSLFNHVRVELPTGGFRRRSPKYQEVRSMHLHCDRSSRYFVVYGSTEPDISEAHGEAVREVVASFSCH